MIDRYSRKEISGIWSLENKYRIWLDIELAVCEANTALGIIPADAMKVIREKASFSVDRINQIEAEVHHDVIAFLTSIAENVGEESRYIHFGMTSSDIGDTALCIQMKQAGEIVLRGVDALIEALSAKALEYRTTPCMGRSHGVHAEPTTFGMKMLLHRESMKRSRERIAKAIENISFGKLSGAVGTFSNIDPVIEEKVCAQLGLSQDPVSTQVIQRDRHAEYVCAMAICAATLDQIATEIRHLQRTEVREAEEPFQKGQKGSSAMPHKRNPILCERITGIARVIKSSAMTALEDVTLWHERDISHSSAERIMLPDVTIGLDYILDKMTFVIKGLHVYPENMTANINRTGGLYGSQRLLLALIEKGLTREEAYAAVQGASMKTWAGEGSLRETFLKTPEAAKFSENEINDIFGLDYFLRHIPVAYRKAGLDA